MGIRFYNLNGFFVKKLAHGVNLKPVPITDTVNKNREIVT